MIKNVVLKWDNTRKEGVYGGYSIQIEFDGDRYEELFRLGRAKLHNGKWVMNLRSQKPIKVLDCELEELTNEIIIGNGSIGNIMLAVPDEPIYFKGQEIRKGIPMIIQVVEYTDYFTGDF
jgi:hypothetical protein